jgi:hypothetical protein
MRNFSKKLRSTVVIMTVVLFGGTYQVWAFPTRPMASPASDSGPILVLCKPGNKNCNPKTGGIPTPCGKTAAGCKIDGGLGSACQGGEPGSCGIFTNYPGS